LRLNKFISRAAFIAEKLARHLEFFGTAGAMVGASSSFDLGQCLHRLFGETGQAPLIARHELVLLQDPVERFFRR
jgi:hypothetical protein